MGDRLDGKCDACGHVWTVAHLPVPVNLLPKFLKSACPKCHALKPLMAGKDDLTAEDHLRTLLRRAHDALTRPAENAMLETDWDQLAADIAQEIGA